MSGIIQQVSWCDGVFNYTAFRTNSIIELHKVQIDTKEKWCYAVPINNSTLEFFKGLVHLVSTT